MNPDSLRNKKFFKFTGPPENWLTAIKFMTWGLEEKYREQWKRILPGDHLLHVPVLAVDSIEKHP